MARVDLKQNIHTAALEKARQPEKSKGAQIRAIREAYDLDQVYDIDVEQLPPKVRTQAEKAIAKQTEDNIDGEGGGAVTLKEITTKGGTQYFAIGVDDADGVQFADVLDSQGKRVTGYTYTDGAGYEWEGGSASTFEPVRRALSGTDGFDAA